MRANFLNVSRWLPGYPICRFSFLIFYLDLKSSSQPSPEGNDKRHKMNSKIVSKSFLAIALHSCKVWLFSQSDCVTSVICVQLCIYSKNLFLMQTFSPNISKCNKENIFIWTSIQTCVSYKTICSFFFKYHLELIYVFSEILL